MDPDRDRDRDQSAEPSHESVDHEHPDTAGLMAPPAEIAPGTGIMGDETLVRDTDPADGRAPGLYPDPPAHTGGAAHPGPTPARDEP